MTRLLFMFVIVTLLPVFPVFADECTQSHYDSLVAEGKSADDNRQWDRSVAVYSSILSDCSPLVKEGEIVRVYDSLAVGQLMQEHFSEAIESAKKCLDQDSKYNACMMTAAKAYESLGDRDMALEFARAAVEAGNHDEYSAAVVIYAKDFLRRLEKQQVP